MPAKTPEVSTLVVCIGNELIADDAVGHEIIGLLRRGVLPAGTRLEYVGLGGIALLDLLTGAENAMIVVDAVQLGAPAGTIHRLEWNEIPPYGNSAIFAHGVGLREAIDVGKILCPDKIPQRIMLIGIEGRCFDQTRAAMTPAVAAAIPAAVDQIREQIHLIHKGV